MDTAVHGVVDNFVKVNQALHTTLSLWFLRLLTLSFRRALEHVLVLFSVLLQLLIECTGDLFSFFSLSCLQLVYLANKRVFLNASRTRIWQAFFDHHLEVTVKEVKSWYVVPGLQGVSREYDDLVFPQQLFQLSLAVMLVCLVPLLFTTES